jgi:glycosyltransferase involved in cell wall biosynthesis
MAGQPFTDEMRSFILGQGLSDRVFSLVNCENEDLRAFYSAAHCLLFPSLAEGFGWPIIEAQACGCPVVCSSVAPFPEVAGEAALMCETMDEKGFGEHVLRLYEPAVRSNLVELGFENASQYAPSKMADGYLRVYRGLQNGDAPPSVL